jgi:hypothetical protein
MSESNSLSLGIDRSLKIVLKELQSIRSKFLRLAKIKGAPDIGNRLVQRLDLICEQLQAMK